MRRAWALAILVFGGFAMIGAAPEQQFECEQAVAHLAECCPGLDAHQFYCADNGCGTAEPDFSTDDGECLQAHSCESLRAAGVCERVRDLPRTGTTTSYCFDSADTCKPTTTTTGHGPICAGVL